MVPTVDVMAKELSVSKQTIRNWAQRLDPTREHIDTTGEAYVLDDEIASMIAHKITQKRSGQREDAGVKSQTIAAVVTTSTDKFDAISSHYQEIIRLKDESHAALMRAKDEQITDLKALIEQERQEHDLTRQQLDQERQAHEETRRQLALSRALEGFHWPWKRREIMTRYALPEPRDGQ